jgi:hypothetical protein
MKRETIRKPLGVIFDFGDTILQAVSADWIAGTGKLLELAADDHGFTIATLQPISTQLALELFAFREQPSRVGKASSFNRSETHHVTMSTPSPPPVVPIVHSVHNVHSPTSFFFSRSQKYFPSFKYFISVC